MNLPSATLLVLLCHLCSGTLAAQLSTLHGPEALLPIETTTLTTLLDCESDDFGRTVQSFPDLNSLLLGTSTRISSVDQPPTSLLYRPHLAFFCRVEVKIDKAVGTPFRFRLGSVDYVDYLEGKRTNY